MWDSGVFKAFVKGSVGEGRRFTVGVDSERVVSAEPAVSAVVVAFASTAMFACS